MSDKSSKNAKSADAMATGIVADLGAFGTAILSAANIPVPSLEECLTPLQKLSGGKKIGVRKTLEEIVAEKNKIEKDLKSNLANYNKLSIKSTGLLAKHADSVSSILLYAKYIQEFEAANDLDMIEKYEGLYIQEKEKLIGVMKDDKEFADFMHDLMASSSKSTNHKLFGVLFHAENYCEPEFQHIADIANTVNLTKLAQSAKMPPQVQMAANLFGRERDYKTVPLASKLGHLVLPVDPSKDNTVYVVCPDLKKYAKNPGQILEDIRNEGGKLLFDQLQGELDNLPLPENWKANIKVVGDNLGGEVAKEYFSAIQKGLQGELSEVPKDLKKHMGKQAKKMAQNAGLGDGVQVLGQLGGAKKLYQHVGSLNLENVQSSPLLNAEFRAANPEYNKFLTKAKIPQSLGTAGLVLDVAQQLGLDQVAKGLIKDADKHLVKYHTYRVAKPGLKFIAENALPAMGMVMSGAAIGSTVPGIGTGVGALIGAGAAVAMMTYKGYGLYKERKQMKLEKEGKMRGMEMHSSYQDLGALSHQAPPMRFSSAKVHGEKPLSHAQQYKPARRKAHEAEDVPHEIRRRPRNSSMK